MRTLREEAKLILKRPIFLAWAFSILATSGGTISSIYFSKQRQLQSTLTISLETVRSALNAGDWDMALAHLKVTSKTAKVFNLYTGSHDGHHMKTTLAGPVGEQPWGLIQFCGETQQGNYGISGCSFVLESSELTALILFFTATSLLALFVFWIVISVLNNLLARIAEDLDFTARDPSGETGKAEILELFAVKERISNLISELNQKTQLEAVANIATQVAHDIRSPLAALSMAERDLSVLPEDTRIIIRSAMSRIQDIASQLMEKAHASRMEGTALKTETPEQPEPTLLSATLETLLAEKRMQYRSRLDLNIHSHFEGAARTAFASVQPRELKRLISNLINNAAEAIATTGTIQIDMRMETAAKNLVIQIHDNGSGIPAHILAQLGTRGFTHNKTGGSGLGLYHARTTVESWGGALDISSQPNNGTTLRVTLPVCHPPSWFLSSLQLPTRTQVVVLDDDQSIHQVWRGRMESAHASQHDVILHHFSTPDEVEHWRNNRTADEKSRPTRYLLDFEILGLTNSGLDLIDKLGIAKEAVLVTSRYEEPTIKERCNALGVPLLPKALAGFIGIALTGSPSEASAFDAILIDDDPLIHMTWTHAARSRGKRLKIFATKEELLEALGALSAETPIYIDSNLGPGVKGEDLITHLIARGFKNLYLATGYEPKLFAQKLEGLPGFKGVVGKDPPAW